MNEQWNRLTRAVGNVFLPILKQVLPYLNAVLMVLTEIINSIAILVGYNEEDFDYFKGAAESVADIETGANGATSAVKKLNNSLRSFDRLNNITTGSGAAGISGVGTGISPDIMKLFNKEVDKYNSTLENVQMKATKIRDSIMDWLGFTKQIDPLTGKISFKFDHITGGTVLGALAIGGVIYKGVKTIFSVMNKFGIGKTNTDFSKFLKNIGKTDKEIEKMQTGFAKFKSTVKGLLVGGTGLLVLSESIKDISKNGKNAANILGSIGGSLASIGGFAYAGYQITGTWQGAAVGAAVGGISALVTALMSYNDEIDKAIDKSKKLVDANKNYVDSIQKSYEEINKNTTAKINEHEQNKKLLDELDTLVDKNGKVKKGYEDRANFIINELNNAYGTEMKLINGEIKGLDKSKQKIQELIKVQELEIIMQANREKYVQARERKSSLSAQYQKEKESLTELYNLMVEAQNEYEKKYDAYRKTGMLSPFAAIDVKSAYDDWTKLIEQYNELDAAHTDLANTIKKDNKIIVDYENMATAQITGDYETINKTIEDHVNTRVENGEIVKNTLKDELEWLENEYYDKLDTMDKEEYLKRRQNLINNLKKQTQTVKEQTPEIAAQWNYLATTSSDEFLKAITSLPTTVQQQVIDKMYEQGYSISNELQKGISAVNPEIKFKTNLSTVETTFKKLFGEGGTWSGVMKAMGIKIPSISTHALGGLPTVGQMFIANEKGPELIGQIGGQSFVANQNQIVDFLHEELGNAKSGNPTTMNFYLDANNKLATYTLDKLQNMAKSNGQPIEIGG